MTAKEYFKKHLSGEPLHQDVVIEAMIEFAKLHVEAALKEAEKETIKYISKTIIELNMYNKNSILNAYPLENIK